MSGIRSQGILAACLILLCILPHVRSALMAIDLGSENIKISIVKPGKIPISIVINEMSKRKTSASLAVVDGDRLVGEEAAALSARYPEKVFTGFRDMLGISYDDQRLVSDLKRVKKTFDIIQAPNRTTVALKTDKGPGITAEEAVASLFEYAASLAREAAEGLPVTDCVLVVPSYFTPGQRQAMKDAASLVHLNVLALVNSHAAAALQYGIERDFANKTEHILFYDLGAKSAEAALVKFSSFLDSKKSKPISQFEVLDVAWVTHNVGGDAMESILVDIMAEKYNGDRIALFDNKRAVAKLRKQAQKAKHVLSANTEVHISIEDLLPGTDFKAHITREEFEKASSDVIDRAIVPVKAILNRNNITVDELDGVELLGGSSRVPMVKSRLSDALNGRSLDAHLDADEAVVLGAGLVAANLSTIFRLRQFGMTDKSMYQVEFKLNDEEKRALVPAMKKVPTLRAIKQENITADSFSVSLEWANEHGSISDSDKIRSTLGKVDVSGIEGVVSSRGYSGKVSLHTSMDSGGIFNIDRADATVAVYMDEQVPILKNTTLNETLDANTTSVNITQNATEVEYETRQVRKIFKDPLTMNVTLFLNSMTKDDILASRKVLREYRERDRTKKELAKSRNDLEAFIIDKSGALQDEDSSIFKYSSEQERQEASKSLTDAEDWIYGEEADSSSAFVFRTKLKAIRTVIDRIEDRIFEASIRDQVIDSSQNFIDETSKAIKSWSKSKPWITKEEIDAIQTNLTDFKNWVIQQAALQKDKALHEDPAFKVQDVRDKLDAVRKAFTRLNIKSKPIEKPPKQKDSVNKEEEGEVKTDKHEEPVKGEDTPSSDHSEL